MHMPGMLHAPLGRHAIVPLLGRRSCNFSPHAALRPALADAFMREFPSAARLTNGIRLETADGLSTTLRTLIEGLHHSDTILNTKVACRL